MPSYPTVQPLPKENTSSSPRPIGAPSAGPFLLGTLAPQNCFNSSPLGLRHAAWVLQAL